MRSMTTDVYSQLDEEILENLTPKQRKKLERASNRRNKMVEVTYTGTNEILHLPADGNSDKLIAKTPRQREYMNLLKTRAQIIAVGPAGVGKTYIPTVMAVQQLREKKIKKIVLTRPNVSMSKSLGYLPGSQFEKFAAWTTPFLEIMKEKLGITMFEYCIKNEIIELVPFETLRGRSFKDAVVIVDEFQSTTVEEAICLVTRIGENSKLIMLGDVKQKDIKSQSGLEFVIDSYFASDSIRDFVGLVEFGIEDVVRSDVCAAWVKYIYAD